MAVDSPWFRQNADWPFTKWLDDLGYPLAGIWSYLLAYVKANGNGRGQCKSIDAALFGRIYRIPTDDAQRFFDAAKEAGAFMDDGKRWTITAWAEYQSPDAGRMRKARAPEQETNVTDNPETLRTTGECSNTVTRQSQRSTIQDIGEIPPKPPKDLPSILKFLPEEWEAAGPAWAEYQEHRRKMPGVSPYQEAGCQKLAAMLLAENYVPDKFARLLAHCMASGWKGIPIEVMQKFEHPGNGRTNGKQRETTEEMMARLSSE